MKVITAAAAEYKQEADSRQYYDGLPLGSPATDIITAANGSIRVRIPFDDRKVKSGYKRRHFIVGQQILVCWWGLWWRAVIVKMPPTKDTLTVKYLWSKKVFCNVEPRLCRPYP